MDENSWQSKNFRKKNCFQHSFPPNLNKIRSLLMKLKIALGLAKLSLIDLLKFDICMFLGLGRNDVFQRKTLLGRPWNVSYWMGLGIWKPPPTSRFKRELRRSCRHRILILNSTEPYSFWNWDNTIKKCAIPEKVNKVIFNYIFH